jgi:hypothetical protein
MARRNDQAISQPSYTYKNKLGVSLPQRNAEGSGFALQSFCPLEKREQKGFTLQALTQAQHFT